MRDRLDLPTPADLEALDHAALPALVAQLAALQSAVAARLLEIPPPATPPPAALDDAVSDVDEVAQLCRRSVSWVRKRGHTLPGFLQPGGKGTRVGWSRRALEAWAKGETC